jgi:hypothetical protein
MASQHSHNELKMDFQKMDEMKASCQQAAEELDFTLSEIENIAGRLEEGALVGEAGDTLACGLRDVLAARLTLLRDKFEEIQRDLEYAKQQMENAQ